MPSLLYSVYLWVQRIAIVVPYADIVTILQASVELLEHRFLLLLVGVRILYSCLPNPCFIQQALIGL